MPTLAHVLVVLGGAVVTAVHGQVSCGGITFHGLTDCDDLCSPVVDQSTAEINWFKDCSRRSWCKFDKGACVFHDFETEREDVLRELDQSGWSPYQRESFVNMMNHAHCSRNNRREKDCGLVNYLVHGDDVPESMGNYTIEDGHESLCGWPSVRGDSFGCHASSQYCNFNKGGVRHRLKACNAHDECAWDGNFAGTRIYRRSDKLYKQYNQACKPKSLLDSSTCDDLSNLPPGSECDAMEVCDSDMDFFALAVEDVCAAVGFDAPAVAGNTVFFKDSGRVSGFGASESYYGSIWDNQCMDTSSTEFRRGQYRHDVDARSTVAELPHYGNQEVSMTFQQDSAQTDATYFQLKRNLTVARLGSCPVGATGYSVYSQPTVVHKECSYFQLDQDCVDKTITSVVTIESARSLLSGEGNVVVGDKPGAEYPSMLFTAQLPHARYTRPNAVFRINQYSRVTEFKFIPAFSELSGKKESRLGRSFERVTRGETTLRDGYVDFSVSQVNATVKYTNFDTLTSIASTDPCENPDVPEDGNVAVDVVAEDDGDRITARMALVDTAKEQTMTVSINKTRTMTEDVALEALQALVSQRNDTSVSTKGKGRKRRNQNVWSAPLGAQEILDAANLNLRMMRNTVIKQIRTGMTMDTNRIAGAKCGALNYTGDISVEYKDSQEEEVVITTLRTPGMLMNTSSGDWDFQLNLELPTLSDDIGNTEAFDEFIREPLFERRLTATGGGGGTSFFSGQSCFSRPSSPSGIGLGSRKGFQVFGTGCGRFGGQSSTRPSGCRCNKLARSVGGSCKMKVLKAGECSAGMRKFRKDGSGWKRCKGSECRDPTTRRLFEAIEDQFSFRGLSVTMGVDDEGEEVFDGSQFFYQPSYQVISVFPKNGAAPIHKTMYPFQTTMPVGAETNNTCAETGEQWSRKVSVSQSTLDDINVKSAAYRCVNESDTSCVLLHPNTVSDASSMKVMLPSGSSDNEYDMMMHDFDLTLTQSNGDTDACGQPGNTKLELDVTVEDYNVSLPVRQSDTPAETRSTVSFASTGNSLAGFDINVQTVNWNTELLRNHDLVLTDQHETFLAGQVYVEANAQNHETLTTTFKYDGGQYCFEAMFDSRGNDVGTFYPSIQFGEDGDVFSGSCDMEARACYNSTTNAFTCETPAPTSSPTMPTPTVSPTKSPTSECPDVTCPNGLTLATTLEKAIVGSDSQRVLDCPICTKRCEDMETVKYALELVPAIRCRPQNNQVMGTCNREVECMDMCEADEDCFGVAFQHVIGERNAVVNGLLLKSVSDKSCPPSETITAWEAGVWATYAKVPICKAEPPTNPPTPTYPPTETNPPTPTYPPSPTDPPSPTNPPSPTINPTSTPDCVVAYFRGESGLQGYMNFTVATQVPEPRRVYYLLSQEACARQSGKHPRLSYKWEPVIGERMAHSGVFSEMYVAKETQKLFQEHTGIAYPESFDDFDVEDLQYATDQDALGECYVKRGRRWVATDDLEDLECREPDVQMMNLLFRYNLGGVTNDEDSMSRCVFSTDDRALFVDRCHDRVLPASSANEVSSQTFELLPKSLELDGAKAGLVELRHYFSGMCIGVGSLEPNDFRPAQRDVPIPHIYFHDATYNVREQAVRLIPCDNDLQTLFEPMSGGRFKHVASGLCLGEHYTGLVRSTLQLQTCDPEVFSTRAHNVPDSGCFTINVEHSRKGKRRKACENYDGCRFDGDKCLENSQYYAPYRIIGPSVVEKDTCTQFHGRKDIDRLQCFRRTECSWIRSQNQCVYEADIFTNQCGGFGQRGLCESYYKCEWSGNRCRLRTECEAATTAEECGESGRERCDWDGSTCALKNYQSPSNNAPENTPMKMFGQLGQSFVPNMN